jgi:hypothetical protein
VPSYLLLVHKKIRKIPFAVSELCAIFQMQIRNRDKVCPEGLKSGPILKNQTFLDSASQSESGNVLFDF